MLNISLAGAGVASGRGSRDDRPAHGRTARGSGALFRKGMRMQEPVKPTVLVVDDDRPIVAVVCEVLDEVQIAAAGCTQTQMAYPWIRAHQPQVVLLDLQMPELDGVEVFRQLRADPMTCAIPVIFFTANAPKLQQRLPDYHALGVELLPKPFDVDTLLGAVTRVLAAPSRTPSATVPARHERA